MKMGKKMHLRSNPTWADDFKIHRRYLVKYTPRIGIYHLCHSVNLINIVFLPVQEELQACIPTYTEIWAQASDPASLKQAEAGVFSCKK